MAQQRLDLAEIDSALAQLGRNVGLNALHSLLYLFIFRLLGRTLHTTV